ncbi:MAG: class II aldolase/adducin family protein [Candidatus Puniceispirillaceae bacterium]
MAFSIHIFIGVNKMTSEQDDPVVSSREMLVKANQILFNHNVVDGFGHVSLRCPDNSDAYMLSANRAPALVTTDDILVYDLSGEPVETTDRPLYLERYIHAAVYSHRPDVMAVVHSHSHTIVPFSISEDSQLRPVWHMAGFLSDAVPVFDTAETFGDETDLLITNMEMADAMAQRMDQHDVVLMRGHGATIAGRNLQEAVYRSIYAELNARIQIQASTLGRVKYMSKAEGTATVERISPQIKRAWDLWCAEIDD